MYYLDHLGSCTSCAPYRGVQPRYDGTAEHQAMQDAHLRVGPPSLLAAEGTVERRVEERMLQLYHTSWARAYRHLTDLFVD